MPGLKAPLTAVLALASSAVGQDASSVRSRLDALVTAGFTGSRCPGLSVVVAKANAIVFSKALGLADIEQKVVLSSDSAHRLASLSKPITGTILMDLVEQGKLNLDLGVRKYLPELPASDENVTTRHLLSHQSGVVGYRDPMEIAFSMTHYPTSRAALQTFMGQPLKFQPGSKTEYSSLSFTVAGAIAESITGRSFQYVAADFFSRHNIAGFYLDDPLAIVPKRVRGYLVDSKTAIRFNDGKEVSRAYLAGTTGPVTNARAYDISNRYPAGGFVSSGEDLIRFVIAVAWGKILKPATVKEMWMAQTTNDGQKGVFGIGWGVSTFDGKPMVGMNGAEPSTTTFFRYLPDSGTAVAVLCNAEGAEDLTKLVNNVLAAAAK